MRSADNPILARLREDRDIQMWDLALRQFELFGGFTTWESETHTFHVITTATAEAVAHARKVIDHMWWVFA